MVTSDLRPAIFCAAATTSLVTARISAFEIFLVPHPERKKIAIAVRENRIDHKPTPKFREWQKLSEVDVEENCPRELLIRCATSRANKLPRERTKAATPPFVPEQPTLAECRWLS